MSKQLSLPITFLSTEGVDTILAGKIVDLANEIFIPAGGGYRTVLCFS
ncbi:MAG: hypothetical protein GX121_05065 [Ignavibacteria bacterium]|nr:hypothetical protein [Ignavibacteria bacterium]